MPLATAFFRIEGMHFRSLFLKAIMPGVMHTATLSSSTLLLNSSHEQQIANSMPRYAEHFVGAAALLGAFGLVFGAMALGAWRTALCLFLFKHGKTAKAADCPVQELGYCTELP